jgi:hypothetical protein
MVIYFLLVTCIGFFVSGYYTCRYRYFKRASNLIKRKKMLTCEDTWVSVRELIELCPNLLKK